MKLLYLDKISNDESFLSSARTQARLLNLFSSAIASLKFSGLSAVENRNEIKFLNGFTRSISEVFLRGTAMSSVILVFRNDSVTVDQNLNFVRAVATTAKYTILLSFNRTAK